MRWRKFSFCISVKRLVLKAVITGGINWGKEGFLQISKVELSFKTQYCVSEIYVPEIIKKILSKLF